MNNMVWMTFYVLLHLYEVNVLLILRGLISGITKP